MFCFPHVRFHIVFAALFAVLCCGPLHAEDAAARNAISKLLSVGWSTAPSARAVADQQYAAVVAAAAGDARGEYAQLLVLLHQRRYDEASKQCDSYLDTNPDDLYAWRARVWLSALMKNHQAALGSGEKMAAVLQEALKNPDQGTFVREQTEFLGRIYGYFSGPLSDKVKAEERKASEKKVLALLAGDLAKEFEQGRDGVLDEFFKRANVKEDAREKAVKDAEEEKTKTLEDVEKTREKIDERKDELKSSADRAKAELDREIADLERQDRPLQSQVARLEVQFAQQEGELSGIIAQINQLQGELNREKDPRSRDRIRREIDRFAIFESQIRGQLLATERAAAVIQAQRNALAAKAAAVRQKFGGEIDRANREFNTLTKQEKKADNIERIAKQPVTGTTSRVTSLSAQATALTTYQPFPLEQEKQRVLDLLK